MSREQQFQIPPEVVANSLLTDRDHAAAAIAAAGKDNALK
jgi:hypothetical protein